MSVPARLKQTQPGSFAAGVGSLAVSFVLLAAPVLAATPPSADPKAAAAEAAARAAWNTKVEGYQLCKAQDRVAARYFAEMQRAGKPVVAPAETAACTDPGPYVAAPRPQEAAGAHSPTETAVKPPSSTAPAAPTGSK